MAACEHNGDGKDELGQAFTKLTARFEDLAAMALDGQSSRQALAELAALNSSIKHEISTVLSITREIDRLIAQEMC